MRKFMQLLVLFMLVWIVSGVVFDWFHECEAQTIFQDGFEDNYSDCSTVTLTGRNITWNGFFKDSWPGPKTEKKRVNIPETGYLSLRFRTGNVQDTGAVSSIEAAGTHGYRLGAISECKGKFEAPTACVWRWGTSGGIRWSTEGGDCELKSNTTYYWNMTFTDGVDPSTSRCIGTYCETWLIAVNNDYE